MTTSSLGLMTAIKAAIMASVEPQVTVISRSGSTSSPKRARVLAAIALRKDRAPQVMAYWFTSARMARQAASLISAGAGKSGIPCARFTAPWSWARRVISRITDSVKLRALFETICLVMGNCLGYVGAAESGGLRRRRAGGEPAVVGAVGE